MDDRENEEIAQLLVTKDAWDRMDDDEKNDWSYQAGLVINASYTLCRLEVLTHDGKIRTDALWSAIVRGMGED